MTRQTLRRKTVTPSETRVPSRGGLTPLTCNGNDKPDPGPTIRAGQTRRRSVLFSLPGPVQVRAFAPGHTRGSSAGSGGAPLWRLIRRPARDALRFRSGGTDT